MTYRIRPYSPRDIADLYDVCVRTADAGRDATGKYVSDDLVGDVFAAPYVAFDPSLAFVVASPTRVVGYVIAVSDTREFVSWFERRWLPFLASRYTHHDPPATQEESIVHLGFTPRRMLLPELDQYPAHLHIDLLPEAQGQGLGRRLIDTLRARLHERGVGGVHLTMDATNTAARTFYDRIGFHELPSSTPEVPALGISTGPVAQPWVE